MDIIDSLNNVIWGTPTLLLMLAAGILFSVGTGFFQLRHIRHWLKSTIFSRSREADCNSVSPFQAMSSALAATLGTGNIAGVSAALAAGGAGAVFWMWISALFGMMTGFAENVLGLYYRTRARDGEWLGGAMRYMERGLSENARTKLLAKPLAVIFAGLCVLSAYGMGNMAQMNSAAGALHSSLNIPPFVTGVVLAAAEAAIIFGGVKRIGKVTAAVVPFMSGFYILGAIWILAAELPRLPSVIGAVIEGAFGIDAVTGGVSGYMIKQAVSMGFRRGVFSNEAGLGTSVAAHTASSVTEPCVQGMWSIFEVFFDTIIMCTLTAAILLASPCNIPTAEEAFHSISLQPQYFRLTGQDTIINDGTYTLSLGGTQHPYEMRTIYSTGFDVPITHGHHTFSNVMTVQGIQSTSENGEPVFLDSDKQIPLIKSVVISEVNGSQLATFAFSRTFGDAAGGLLAIAVVLFAFSTMVGWSSFGAQAAVYLFGKRAEKPFKWLFIAATALSVLLDFSAVWGICDLTNGLMALPNLLTLFLLAPKVLAITKNYCLRTFKGARLQPMLSADTQEGKL